VSTFNELIDFTRSTTGTYLDSVVYGDELVTNGDFNDGTTGWLTTAGATLSVVDGELIVSGDGVSAYGRAFQPLTTSVGSVYSLTFDFTKTVSNLILTAGAVDLATISSSGTYTYTFVATNTTTSIIFKIQNDANGELTLDNISVREINPLSVSIQMDGRMTYADEDNVAQVERVYWYANSNNYIRLRIATNGGDIGQPTFTQAASGTADAVVGATDAYSPNILVPYNLASRHGSTFINGAVDGVALTADTTPVALADLSSTDLSLAYTYMGTIKTFRIWDKDLGDTGIAEATS